MNEQNLGLRELAQKYAARPLKFYHKEKKRPNGETYYEDWVSWTCLGRSIETVTNERVSSCMKTGKWPLFEAGYEAFKKGTEIPETGTPLFAWPAITSEQVEVFRQKGLKTIEDLADITDSVIASIRLPGVREIVKQAKSYLDNKDTVAAAANMQRVVDENDDLKARLIEMEDMIKELAANKPRRGRPPKSETEGASSEDDGE
jgi:hypothetical protein